MQYGMPTLIENHTLEENAALCEELGLKFIELNMNFPEYQIDRLAFVPRKARHTACESGFTKIVVDRYSN